MNNGIERIINTLDDEKFYCEYDGIGRKYKPYFGAARCQIESTSVIEWFCRKSCLYHMHEMKDEKTKSR